MKPKQYVVAKVPLREEWYVYRRGAVVSSQPHGWPRFPSEQAAREWVAERLKAR